MRKVSLETSTRYIRRFGGYHEQYWTEYDRKHVIGKIRLFNEDRLFIAEIDTNFKPLPKSTVIGHLIAMAIGAL